MRNGGPWWEIEIHCEPADQMRTIGRLLPPGFAFYVREPERDERLVRTYVPQERVTPDWLGAAYFNLLLDARKAHGKAPEITWRSVTSWSIPRAARARWRARQVGERVLVLPEWESAPDDTDRVVVRIDPRFGFGDAAHATTALCLEALETLLGRGGGTRRATLADIGCGSGILAIAAIALGAGRVYAVDTDAAAVRSTAENRDLNDIRAERLVVQQGTIDRLRATLSAPVDGFLCNLFADVIVPLIPSFGPIAHRRTWGVLSGLRPDDEPMLTARLADAGWSVNRRTERESWCCLVIERSV